MNSDYARYQGLGAVNVEFYSLAVSMAACDVGVNSDELIANTALSRHHNDELPAGPFISDAPYQLCVPGDQSRAMRWCAPNRNCDHARSRRLIR